MKKSQKKDGKLTTATMVGIYQLGYRWVEVWLDPSTEGGNFTYLPGTCRDPKKEKSHSKITVGREDQLWSAWAILVHESLEFLLAEEGVRLRPTGHYSIGASDIYRFHFDHNQFTEVAARLGCFVYEVRPRFEATWRKFK